MCIIAYKPQNVAMPSKKLLQICFNNNPDGAGYMIASGGNVIYRKGFMDFGGFYSSLTSAIKRYGEDVPYVLHFRISTQAGVNKQCCHPFPLSDDMDDHRMVNILDLTERRNQSFGIVTIFYKTIFQPHGLEQITL